MKLATIRDGTRDGALVILSSDGRRYLAADAISETLQNALDHWAMARPALERVARELDADATLGVSTAGVVFDAPLPRAYEWVDGSAYLNHIVLVRKARGAELPATLETEPLVYQGGSSAFLGCRDEWVLPDVGWGLDYEAEVAVVLTDTPRGTTRERALEHVALIVLLNDWSYRHLIPDELGKGFGFFQSKPTSAFGPVAVTPDELGPAWRDGRAHLTMRSWVNGVLMGDPETGREMHFSFADLIAHITKTRAFGAGTILGSGTVANTDPVRGASCLVERRMREIIERGNVSTPFLKIGDVVAIELVDGHGNAPCGRIEQRVVAPGRGSS